VGHVRHRNRFNLGRQQRPSGSSLLNRFDLSDHVGPVMRLHELVVGDGVADGRPQHHVPRTLVSKIGAHDSGPVPYDFDFPCGRRLNTLSTFSSAISSKTLEIRAGSSASITTASSLLSLANCGGGPRRARIVGGSRGRNSVSMVD